MASRSIPEYTEAVLSLLNVSVLIKHSQDAKMLPGETVDISARNGLTLKEPAEQTLMIPASGRVMTQLILRNGVKMHERV